MLHRQPLVSPRCLSSERRCRRSVLAPCAHLGNPRSEPKAKTKVLADVEPDVLHVDGADAMAMR
eukprot:8617594-Pyramimonas_sp.AAC.1